MLYALAMWVSRKYLESLQRNAQVGELLVRLIDLLEAISANNSIERQAILKELQTIMADTKSILAKVTANNDVLKSLKIGVDILKEGHVSLAEDIQDLKDQVANGQTPDFTAVDTGLDEQKQVLDDLVPAVGANTQAAGQV